MECENETDCDGNGEKICHENKCICNKDRPIELEGNCLPMQFIDDPCQADGQCLGGSHCIEGICSCGPNSISQRNPSQGIVYCHPNRQLDESCNYDIQCPNNAYCSTTCLCHNGFAPAIVKASLDGSEVKSCLPISCTNVDQCESAEFYQCIDDKCKCLPTHFDPTRAKCYRFGSLGLGLEDAVSTNNSTKNQTNNQFDKSDSNDHQNVNTINPISTIINDLIHATTGRADLFWLLVVLILITLLFLFAIFYKILCGGSIKGSRRRRHLLFPCCWTAHKHQEWDPADEKAAPPDGAAFLHDDGLNRKNSVNQKSFRRKKNLDTDHESVDEFCADDDYNKRGEGDCVGGDHQKSSLMKSVNTATAGANGKNHINQIINLTSKINDYEVIYFGKTDQKQKLKMESACKNNNKHENDQSLIKTATTNNHNSKDEQLRINPMMGSVGNQVDANGREFSSNSVKQNNMMDDTTKNLFLNKPTLKQPKTSQNHNHDPKHQPESLDMPNKEDEKFKVEQLSSAKLIVPTNSTLV